MDKDVATVGLSSTADRLLKELVEESQWFDREVDAYRTAVAVALGRRLEPIPVKESRTTKFNVGTLETAERKVAALIKAFAPEHRDTPYAYSQELAEAGIRFLHQSLIEESSPIHEAVLIE